MYRAFCPLQTLYKNNDYIPNGRDHILVEFFSTDKGVSLTIIPAAIVEGRP